MVEPTLAKRIQGARLLTREEESKYVKDWQKHKDHYALTRLVESQLRFCAKMAQKFLKFSTIPFDDLMQEAVLGVMRALDTFEPKRGFKLTTYASYWIDHHLQRYLQKNGNMVRGPLSGTRYDVFIRIRKTVFALAEANEPVTIESIAEKLKTKPKLVLEVMGALPGRMVYLDSPSSLHEEESEHLIDKMRDTSELVDSDLIENEEADHKYELLHQALNQLDSREWQIIMDRFFVGENNTLQNVGDKLGLSRGRIRQIENHAIFKLRKIVKRELLMEAVRPKKSTGNAA